LKRIVFVKRHVWFFRIYEDRSEQHDLAAKYPEKVTEMAKAYEAWAKRCMVEPYPGQKKK
jgi:arylsulfatase